MSEIYNSLNEFAKNYGIYISLGSLAFGSVSLIIIRRLYLNGKKRGKELLIEARKVNSKLESMIEEGIHDELEQKFLGRNKLN